MAYKMVLVIVVEAFVVVEAYNTAVAFVVAGLAYYTALVFAGLAYYTALAFVVVGLAYYTALAFVVAVVLIFVLYLDYAMQMLEYFSVYAFLGSPAPKCQLCRADLVFNCFLCESMFERPGYHGSNSTKSLQTQLFQNIVLRMLDEWSRG